VRCQISKKGFALVELLVVVGIVLVLISLLLPAIAVLRQEARRRVCQSELRQLSIVVSLYCNDNNGRFPFPYKARPDGNWETSNGLVLSPAWALSARSYWPMAMFDEFGGTMYAEELLCKDDSISLEYRSWIAMKRGVPESEVQARAIRGLSASLYLDSTALRESRDRWESWYLRVNSLHDAQFPSQKSFIVEDQPFHDYPYIPATWPDGFHLMASALDGSAQWRSSVGAAPPISLGLNRATGLPYYGVPPTNLDPFQFTRDGIRGYDW
jgi:prepilin-type N-terminal cleavage/methylation domain-containing protein